MKQLISVILLLTIAVPYTTLAAKKKQKKKQGSSIEASSISIHRTVCFGMCPDYIVELKKDGTAIYTANRFTPDTGIFRKNVGKDKVAKVFDMLTRYRADTCKDMYENRIPDLPGLNITIKYAKRTKKIYSANFGPEFLGEIADAVDELGKKTDNAGWKIIGMPRLE